MNQHNFKISELVGPQLAGLQRNAVIAAVIGAVLCVAGLLLSGEGWHRFMESYLFAFMFWFGITLGSLGWLMVHHVTGGGWGFILRRMLEAATRNLWFIALGSLVFLLPLLLGKDYLFNHWSDPHHVQGDKVLEAKVAYLNVPFFIARSVFYFVVWGVLIARLNAFSKQQNTSDDPKIYERATQFSAFGLVLFVITVTFAVFDWIMSLTPHWFSSLLGVIFIGSSGLSTLALMAYLLSKLAGKTDIVARIEPRYIRDIGNLMLAFTLFWAYTNFSQFLIYWSGNIAEEVEFYTDRLQGVLGNPGPYLAVGALLCIFHFFFPFFALLSSALKVNINNLAKIALFILVMRQFDLWWYVIPTFRKAGAHDWTQAFSLTDLGAPLLLGGIWLYLWAMNVSKEMAVPVGDPRLKPHWPLKELEVAHHG